MSVNSFRKPLALAASAIALGGAGLGVAHASSSSSSSSTSSSTARPRGGGMLTAAQRTALATKLGVTRAQLEAGLKAIQPAHGTAPPTGTKPPTGSTGAAGAPTKGARPGGDLAAKLAKQLGLSTATVQAALDAVRPAQGTAPPAAA